MEVANFQHVFLLDNSQTLHAVHVRSIYRLSVYVERIKANQISDVSAFIAFNQRVPHAIYDGICYDSFPKFKGRLEFIGTEFDNIKSRVRIGWTYFAPFAFVNLKAKAGDT